MKIAVIGTGIAGNVAAYRLRDEHEISVFEANSYVGGHTNTVDVSLGGVDYAVDTGFIVFNDWTYPEFIRLLAELDVESQPSNMGFSVRCDGTGLEYNGATLSTLFAQRRNLLRPSFHRMIRDILRFNKVGPAVLERETDSTLGAYLAANGYSQEFIDHYIVPMGAAIWSAEPAALLQIPVRFFVRFFNNHGMLSVNERPTWRVIKGGSRSYVDKLVDGHRDRIRLSNPVAWVRRSPDFVEIKPERGEPERFDQVFISCHSDQALKLLRDPSPLERAVLSAIEYQENEALLHTDESLMPRARRAWAAWNYHIPREPQPRVAVTYNMNILQTLDAPVQFCVTLNNSEEIAEDRIIRRFIYSHPVFTPASVAAQSRQRDLNGANRTYYCGAYWRNGFHEDGVVSALSALEHFEEADSREERYLRRAG